MKVSLRGAIVVIGAVAFFCAGIAQAGGDCSHRSSPTCRSSHVVQCCKCNCGSAKSAPESATKESAPRKQRSVGYVVESAPVMNFGMMMPVAFGMSNMPTGFRPESGVRPESSDVENCCKQLEKDVKKLSEEVEKLVGIVDKHGKALDAVVERLEKKGLLKD